MAFCGLLLLLPLASVWNLGVAPSHPALSIKIGLGWAKSLTFATGQTPTTPAVVNLRQGTLEASNVQPVIEISHMIEVMRAYQVCAPHDVRDRRRGLEPPRAVSGRRVLGRRETGN